MCDRKQRYEDLELDVRSGYIESLSLSWALEQDLLMNLNICICGKLASSCITKARNLSDDLYKVHVYDGAGLVMLPPCRAFFWPFLLSSSHSSFSSLSFSSPLGNYKPWQVDAQILAIVSADNKRINAGNFKNTINLLFPDLAIKKVTYFLARVFTKQ